MEHAPPVRAVHKVHKDVAVVGQIPDTEEWTEWDKHDKYWDKFRITDTGKIHCEDEDKRQTTESALEHSEWNVHDYEYMHFAFFMITAKP